MATVIVFILGCRSIQTVARAPWRSTRRNSLTTRALSSRNLRVLAVAEQPAQDLAGSGLGNLRDEDETARALEPGQVGALPTVTVENVGREPVGGRDHEGHHALAPARVGLAHHRHFAYGGVPGQHVLDLDRMDVLAAADEH